MPIAEPGRVEAEHQGDHLTRAAWPVQDDARTAAELGGRHVRGVGAGQGVEHVVGHVQAQVDARRRDHRERASHQCHSPCRAATAMPSPTGTTVADRNGRRVARRKSHPPAELRLHGAALLARDLVQVPVGLRDAALGELEERHLLLVPVLHPLRSQLVSLAGRPQPAPHRDVPALVVADPRLGTDVAEEDVHLAVDRQRHGVPGHPVEHHHLAVGIGVEAGRHRQRVPDVVDEGDHRVGEAALQGVQRGARRAHRAAPSSSKTCGGREVSPSSHR